MTSHKLVWPVIVLHAVEAVPCVQWSVWVCEGGWGGGWGVGGLITFWQVPNLKGESSERDTEGLPYTKKVCWFWNSNLKCRRINSFLKINVQVLLCMKKSRDPVTSVRGHFGCFSDSRLFLSRRCWECYHALTVLPSYVLIMQGKRIQTYLSTWNPVKIVQK